MKQIPVGSNFDTLKKYSGSVYKPETISKLPNNKKADYASQLLEEKFSVITKFLHNKSNVLDVGCGNGIHLLWLANKISKGTGADFSKPFIDYARNETRKRNVRNINFICSDAKKMPFETGSFDLAYSLSTLYHMPEADQVIKEMARVVKTKGYVFLDMGNYYSINTVACLNHPELAYPCHLPLSKIMDILKKNNLKIVEHKAFQLLPLWSDKPWWLYPLLHPIWIRIMTLRFGNKMLDEIISSAPLLNKVSFRHLLLCQKN